MVKANGYRKIRIRKMERGRKKENRTSETKTLYKLIIATAIINN